MACGGITTLIDQWRYHNNNWSMKLQLYCRSPRRAIPYTSAKTFTTIIDQWNCNCNAGVPAERFPTHQPKQDNTSYLNYLLCTNCTTFMYINIITVTYTYIMLRTINVINVTHTYIMLRTIKPTYLMTVHCLRGAALIGLCLEKTFHRSPICRGCQFLVHLCMWA